MEIEAIILAGAEAGDFDTDGTLLSRSMVKICDRPMLDWVTEAICKNSYVTRCCVIGNVETKYADVILEPCETIVKNIKKCLNEFVCSEYLLLCTSDIPLIDSDCVTQFIEEAQMTKADFVYPICRKDICIDLYPDLKRTFVKLEDGEFTGGNIMFMKTDFLRKILPFLEKLFNARKSPIKLSKILGMRVLFKLILSRFNPKFLDIEYLEKTVSSILGSTVKAVITPYPELCEDLDKPSELNAFEEILKKRRDL